MPDRKDIIINNLLSEICEKTEITSDEYKPWLMLEVGLTEAEIKELEQKECFPTPVS